ncbi:hypothetical protein FA13DRAFT_1726913 [Coprinellus micaceus]|uniref:Uncharacterized protein n=1 Tax=Coprinellus micaceus TaxID=71717 RepID=A0A4Y7TQV8_COPMI|nr:hypothetical protein FA13DRAFT_1726913 [Coprinellus micaceus]
MTIVRTIAESALIYTAVMFAITGTVLYYAEHPSQIIVQHTIPPVTGGFARETRSANSRRAYVVSTYLPLRRGGLT